MDEVRYHEAFMQEIEEHTYTVAIGAAQLSLLALYWRLFSANNTARISTIVLTFLTSCWIVVRVRNILL